MSRVVVIAGVAVTGAVGYGIACWLARMTVYAERLDRERYLKTTAVPGSVGKVAA
jgi:hypothetical protein